MKGKAAGGLFDYGSARPVIKMYVNTEKQTLYDVTAESFSCCHRNLAMPESYEGQGPFCKRQNNPLELATNEFIPPKTRTVGGISK